MGASFFMFALVAVVAPLLSTVSGQTACLDATSTTTTFIVNPTSCQAWIGCNAGKIVNTGSCASGYLFNNSTGSCAAASSVTCATSDVENICVGQTDGSYVANPDNCKSYFYCTSNIGYAGLCTSGYYYNSTLKVCQYGGSDYVCPTASSTASTTAAISCSSVPDGTFLPSNTSCSGYYVCESGQPIAGSCNASIPLYFNSLTGSCDYASNVKCDISSSGATQTTISVAYNYTAICGTSNSTAHFAADPANCTGYFYCSSTTDAAPSHAYCPDSLYFDASIQECATPSSVNCVIEPCVNEPVGYFATNEEGCESFYYCSASGKQAGNCTTGYYFDVINQDCNSPSSVTCTIVPASSSNSTSTSGSSNSTTTGNSTTTSNSTSTATGNSTTTTTGNSTATNTTAT